MPSGPRAGLRMRQWPNRLLSHPLFKKVASRGLVGYPLILCWRYGWLPSPQGTSTTALRDGRVMKCQLDDNTQRTMFLNLFEPAETALMRKLLGPGDVFIDVGAHIGWFTTVASKCVGDGRVVAFEPFVTNAFVLKENLKANSCDNVVVVEAALGEQAGTISLARGSDSGSVTALPWAHEDRIDVPVMALDEVDVGIELGSAALLKIDVEGWEPHALRGGKKVLSSVRRVIIEVNRPSLEMAGSSAEEVFDLLRAAGFTDFLRIVQRFPRRYIPSDVFNVLAVRPSDQINGVLGSRRRSGRRLVSMPPS